ncbi:tetratricopeptide repeat protein [Streptomyces sp. KS 21]|uniref:tetratricopeptide repeat protein n=1 Tax=Streptomyces sp. KS 21 TaxID=2485150 RepID=UPI0010644F3A|nr:tetratricopeptide repeat protein [Streptomyces sp. KS 21]TDU80426.1 tetratricopeptide repeat protein [Streptomyces sp. KS 21]
MSRALQQADALFDLGRHEQAAALAAQHLADNPDDATALVLLARCHHHLGDEQQALTTLEHALRVAPESVSAWLMHTHVLLALKQYKQAEGSARRAVELAPQHWASHYTLGIVLGRGARRKRKRAAYESARTAVALAPEESDAYVLLGLTAHHTGNHRVAQQAYETALRLNPDSSAAHNNLALLHLRRRWLRPGSWTRAAEGFVRSAALDLNAPQARYNLENMAWGTLMGSRWVALAGTVAVSLGSAHLRAGAAGTDALVTYLVCAAVLVGSWGGWLLWQTRRVLPHLRRPLLLVSRGCRPVLGMAFPIALLIVHSALALVLWRSAVFAALAIPLFFFVIVTSVAGRAALQQRAPKP